MSSAAERHLVPFSHLEQLREGREVVRAEAEALEALSRRLDGAFCSAARFLADCRGRVIVTGMGKAGLIGRKIAATLSSTGTRSHFLHPADAVHGDLGCLHADDVLLALSNSGETEELCRILPIVQQTGVPIVAVTASESSTLGSQAEVTVSLGRLHEAGLHGLAPTVSTTVMLAVGDALALVVGRIKGLTPQQFARFHPGGSLGRRFRPVREIMRRGNELRTASETATVREVFVNLSRPGRRTGAVMLVDAEGRLTGLFTDSDLARLLERRSEAQLDRPILEVMSPDPLTVPADMLLSEVVELLSEKKISELPVVDGDGLPVGLIDITDVIGHVPGPSE